jgi:glutathione peroxidase
MKFRRNLLKILYPVLMWVSGVLGIRNASTKNINMTTPNESFFALTFSLNDGTTLNFADLKGKKVLLVNTASNCGYTNQYEALQQLHEQYGSKLIVIGFPANDFKEQEKGTDEQIASFCKLNYGVTFRLAKKSSVIGTEQNDVFRWLTDKTKNGWNEQQPTWNFSKYLVSEEGVLLNYFDPGVSPMSREVIAAINK